MTTETSRVPIFATLNRIPGGLMLIPLILGSIVGTFAPDALAIGSFTTALFKNSALPLIALLIFGGDVLRGFEAAITFGVLPENYSSIFMAKNFVLWLGVNREPKQKPKGGTTFADIDA